TSRCWCTRPSCSRSARESTQSMAGCRSAWGDKNRGQCLGPESSAERERKSPHARIEKLGLELFINDGLGLPDQLIGPLISNRAVALLIHIATVSSGRGFSLGEHAEPNGGSSGYGRHNQMKIPGVKAVADPAVGLVQHRGPFLQGPIT